MTNTGASIITGDVGVSPGTAITGFPPGTVVGGSIHAGDAAAAVAHSDAAIAYAFLAGMASSPANNLTGLDLGGMTLAPGVYKFNTSAQLTGTLTLDAQGDPTALFVIQVGTTLITASGASVGVINGGAGYDTSNVFWQVGTSATLGSGTSFTGNILASASITCVNGSSMTGNALALNGAVTMDANTNTSPPLVIPPTPGAPIVPLNLTAVLTGTAQFPGADLTWNDASNNETQFRLFRRDGAGPSFVLVATIATADMAGIGGMMTYHDPVLVVSRTYTYRVTASSPTDGESLPSNEALIDTADYFPPVPPPDVVPPLDLTAVLSGSVESPGADLLWHDGSNNESEFRVYRRDGAGPAFVQVGTVTSTNMFGTGGAVTFHDPLLDPSTTFTYRVTAFDPLYFGESGPSPEALIDTADVIPPIPPPVRWLDVHVGGKRNVVSDDVRARRDNIVTTGSYSVIDVDTGLPAVLHDVDPRTDGISIQVRAPGNLVLLNIPANDPRWKVMRKGVYRWGSFTGRSAPRSIFRINTRLGQFSLKTKGHEFGSVPLNSITVSLTYQGATGSDTRSWNAPAKMPHGHQAVFKLPK